MNSVENTVVVYLGKVKETHSFTIVNIELYYSILCEISWCSVCSHQLNPKHH